MSVYRPDKKPYYLFDFVWKGCRFYGSTGCPDKDDAKLYEAAERRKAALAEHFPTRKRLALRLALGRYWMEVAQPQSSAKTVWGYLCRLEDGLGRNTYLDEIDADRLAAYISTSRGRKIQSAKAKDAKLVAPATVNREIECLRRVLNRARNVWKIETPVIDWRDLLLTEPDAKITPLAADVEERLIAAAAPHLRPAIRFALLTGVRLQNAVKLDWRQVDLETRVITFRVKSRKPGGRTLVLPILDEVRALLGTLDPRESGPVFTYYRMHKDPRTGKPVRTPGRPIASNWRTAWEGAKRRAGVSGLRWHDLRHTFATRLLQRGAGLKPTQELMGHADIRSTLRYQHYDLEDKRRTLELLKTPLSPRPIPDLRNARTAKRRKTQ